MSNIFTFAILRCNCSKCKDDLLQGAREHRCCQEIHAAYCKLVVDGRAVRLDCITQHADYLAVTNPAVLRQTGPLLRGKDGRPYKQKARQSKNEYAHLQLSFLFQFTFVFHFRDLYLEREHIFYSSRYLRAVAYRWVIRYIFGYLGWDNARPLPACVYHHIRSKYPTNQFTGFASSADRD